MTTILRWIDDDATGIGEIDREHQRLYALAQQMHEAMLAGKGKDFLTSQYVRLMNFALQHFSHEEQVMEQAGYPELAQHRRAHDEIRARLRAVADRLAAGEITLTIEAMQYFVETLNEQVNGIDRRLGGWLAARGIKGDLVPRTEELTP